MTATSRSTNTRCTDSVIPIKEKKGKNMGARGWWIPIFGVVEHLCFSLFTPNSSHVSYELVYIFYQVCDPWGEQTVLAYYIIYHRKIAWLKVAFSFGPCDKELYDSDDLTAIMQLLLLPCVPSIRSTCILGNFFFKVYKFMIHC